MIWNLQKRILKDVKHQYGKSGVIMRIRSVVGYSIDVVNKEIELAIEKTYPIAEGKRYIALFNVTDYIIEKKEMFPVISTQHERYLKLLVNQYCQIKNWKKYARSKGPSKSAVFIRPDVD